MKFSIVVYAAPYSSEAATTAYNFSRTLLEQGHEIYRLFFFSDGVHNVSQLTVVAQDEINLQQCWHKLIDNYELDSVACVSSAIKRGIIDEQESTRHEKNAVSIHTSTEIAGLGQLVDAAVKSDRVVSFG